MSAYKVVDTQFDRQRDGVYLTQIIHAPIRQPSGGVKTFILSASVNRQKSDRGWSNGMVSVLDSEAEGWGGIVSVGRDDVVRQVPSPKDTKADHQAALEAVAAGLLERAIRVLTIVD
ncbi:hypothetical protein ASG71_05875 [Arthrobacter sp. Soil763]|nr:hypothetical protein ASG71_05875 [Arthrobacter sp. Soil763]